MKNIKYFIFSMLLMGTLASCNDYLDVNENPNFPFETAVPPHVLLPPMIQQYALGIAFDARFIGRYTQNLVDVNGGNVWDRHGFAVGSDAGGEIWRNHYWALGKNMDVMIDTARKAGRNVYIGMGYALKAMSWQTLTDYHGDVILTEAYRDQTSFAFDGQDKVYEYVRLMCDSALFYFNLPSVPDPRLAAADQLYGGDVARWRRLVWGVRARNLNHLSSKSTYNADAIIQACDSSLSVATHDATVPYDATITNNTNFFGPFRDNLRALRISGFVASLANGTNPAVTTGYRDPRSASMFAIAATDSIVRGAEPGNGAGATVLNPWGTTTALPQNRGRYLFADNARFPIMTSFEIAFIRAEAQFRKGNKTAALADYRRAIGLHVDFINVYAALNSGTTPAIATTAKTALLADTRLVPTVADSLSMRRIINQKYFADWGWNFVESWVDMRRFRYNAGIYDGQTIFNLTIPVILFNENRGRLAYRVRPRFNSEYVWNRESLAKIGGLDNDYHCKEMWFMQP